MIRHRAPAGPGTWPAINRPMAGAACQPCRNRRTARVPAQPDGRLLRPPPHLTPPPNFRAAHRDVSPPRILLHPPAAPADRRAPDILRSPRRDSMHHRYRNPQHVVASQPPPVRLTLPPYINVRRLQGAFDLKYSARSNPGRWLAAAVPAASDPSVHGAASWPASGTGIRPLVPPTTPGEPRATPAPPPPPAAAHHKPQNGFPRSLAARHHGPTVVIFGSRHVACVSTLAGSSSSKFERRGLPDLLLADHAPSPPGISATKPMVFASVPPHLHVNGARGRV